MMDQTTNRDNLDSADFIAPARPPMLNVLTILTIIGCSIFLIFTLATPGIMSWSKDMMDKSNKSEMTPKQATKMEEARAKIDLTEKNMVPIMGLNILGIGLCFFGALMMRKLKKDGYWLYVAGQVIPLIGGVIIMGVSMYAEPTSIFAILIALTFIILYTTQRKYLVL